jgi:hypothetical protein
VPRFSSIPVSVSLRNPPQSSSGGDALGTILCWERWPLRISGVFFIGILIAAAFYLYLGARDATSSFDAVTTVASTLRESDVDGSALDRRTASEIISAMEILQAEPETISDHLSELKIFAATAASWAEAAATPSAELHVAVAIRRAAGELRGYALTPSDLRLMRSRRLLAAARSTLEGLGGDRVSGDGPGLAVGAVRDRIDNLQQSHQERIQEVDEELNN